MLVDLFSRVIFGKEGPARSNDTIWQGTFWNLAWMFTSGMEGGNVPGAGCLLGWNERNYGRIICGGIIFLEKTSVDWGEEK